MNNHITEHIIHRWRENIAELGDNATGKDLFILLCLKEIEELKVYLKKLEWDAQDSDDQVCCSNCYSYRSEGHTPSCEVGQLLKDVKEIDGPFEHPEDTSRCPVCGWPYGDCKPGNCSQRPQPKHGYMGDISGLGADFPHSI